MTLAPHHRNDFLVPDWPAPANVRALCTTRSGGASVGAYGSLNLGSHVGDAAPAVAHNRGVLQGALGAGGGRAVFLRQEHGTDMLELTIGTQDGCPADGAFTRERGLACTIMVADCLPILLCDRRGTTVAAVHAGWRGLAGVDGKGVLEAIYEQFIALAPVQYACDATELIAWLGPCIGPEAFEVGADVVKAFTDGSQQTVQCFKPQANGKWLADLPALARHRLGALGVTQVFGNDGSPPWCTVGNPSRFFSYRRDGVSGRQAASIWLE